MTTAVCRKLVSTRFSQPVSAFPSVHICYKRRFVPPVYTSLLGVPPQLDSATLVKGNHVFHALAAESNKKQTLLWSGRRNRRRVRGPKTQPLRAGPGPRKRVVFKCLCNNEIHPGSASRKISKSYLGPKVRKWLLAMKRNTFVANGCESRRQANKKNNLASFSKP